MLRLNGLQASCVPKATCTCNICSKSSAQWCWASFEIMPCNLGTKGQQRSAQAVTSMQVILELVFGMDEKRLTPELLERCRAAFDVFDENLLSFPINLPGFGKTTLSCTRLLIASRAGNPAPTHGEVYALQGGC